MDDLINRQAAIKYIKQQRARLFVGCTIEEAMITILEELPSAQQEIVRCKDCKHRDAETGFCEGRGWPMQLVPYDGFCDKGERREDD